MTSSPAIETHELTKRFGDVTAIDGLELTVERGEVYGFLGPNGAGKSTTINVLLGFVAPTSGSATVLGHDAQADSLAVRQSTGVLPEDFGPYERLSARRHVQFAIDCRDADDDPDALLERVGLGDAADQPAGEFSTGMERRLALAIALTGEPELLILDEPTSGLDPNGVREVRSIVREELERGAAVFFSSHSMAQVEAVCDRVGIMREGRLVAEDGIGALKERFDAETRLVVSVDAVPEDVVERVDAVPSVTTVAVEGTDVIASLTDAAGKAEVVDAVETAGATVLDISSEEPSLAELFAAYTTGARQDGDAAGADETPGSPSESDRSVEPEEIEP